MRSPPGAAENVVVALGLGRDADDVPAVAVAAFDEAALAAVALGQDAAGDVVLMPAGGDADLPRARLLAREQIVEIGVPGLLADQRGIRLLAALDQVVPDHAVGAVAGDAGEQAGAHVFGAVGQRPLVRGRALGRELRAEDALGNSSAGRWRAPCGPTCAAGPRRSSRRSPASSRTGPWCEPERRSRCRCSWPSPAASVPSAA